MRKLIELGKTRLFPFVVANRNAEKALGQEQGIIEEKFINCLEMDLIIYDKNPFPQATFMKFYPYDINIVEEHDFDYNEGICFKGIIERKEQIGKRCKYTIKTPYGVIWAELLNMEREVGEVVRIGIPNEELYYFDIDMNRLN